MTREDALMNLELSMRTDDMGDDRVWLPREVRQIAIDAIEKQIPMKPKEYEDKFYACPVCGNVVHHKWVKYPTILMPKLVGLPYCLNCGQRLDWSDEDE